MPVTANFTGPVQTDAINRFRMLQSMARAYLNGGPQSITSGVDAPVSFDTAEINTDGQWKGGSPTRLTAPIAGKYLVLGGVSFATSGAGTYRQIFIRKNGGTLYAINRLAPTAGTSTNTTITDIVPLAAGDYVEFLVGQDSGGNLDAQVGRFTFGAMLYIGE